MTISDVIAEPKHHITQDDQWEAFVSEGLQYREDRDERFWKLGELVSRVKKQYGKSSVDLFSNEIGEYSKTLRGYYRVWKQFSQCGEFRAQNALLSFSHYRAVLRMKKQGLQAMLDLLTQANDNRWNASFTEARAIDAAGGKPDAPRLKRVCKNVPATLVCLGLGVYELTLPLDIKLPDGNYFATISQAITEDGTPILKSVPATAGPAITRPEFPIVEDETP